MIKLFSILAILFLIQFVCGFGSDIAGQIIDTQGNPVEGATLELVVWDQKKDKQPTKTIETTKTGSNGRFEIALGKENPETKLVLTVEKKGYKITVLKFTPQLVQRNDAVFKDYKVILEKNE